VYGTVYLTQPMNDKFALMPTDKWVKCGCASRLTSVFYRLVHVQMFTSAFYLNPTYSSPGKCFW